MRTSFNLLVISCISSGACFLVLLCTDRFGESNSSKMEYLFISGFFFLVFTFLLYFRTSETYFFKHLNTRNKIDIESFLGREIICTFDNEAVELFDKKQNTRWMRITVKEINGPIVMYEDVDLRKNFIMDSDRFRHEIIFCKDCIPESILNIVPSQ